MLISIIIMSNYILLKFNGIIMSLKAKFIKPKQLFLFYLTH